MKVSILLTCYNLVNEIDAAIESVVCQEMPFEWELLIGDDGSNDGTVEKIENWQKKYSQIRLFVMERSKTTTKNGKRAAQNRANLLEKASGEFLIFLDGDDQFLGNDKIRRQVELLEDSKYTD